MAAGAYTWKIPQGTYQRRTFTYLSAGGAASVNLTGMTAKMQIRPYKGSSAVMLTLTTAGGGIVLGGTAGTIQVTMTTAQTAALTSDGYYDIELIDAGGEVDRIAEGAIKWSRGVTE